MTRPAPPGPDAVLYSDPNCPFCYATEERLHAIAAGDRVVWRGVQHAPRLPVPMLHSDRPGGEDLADEVRSIRQLAPEVPIEVPAGKPNTAVAITWAAAALAAHPVAGRAFVREMYRAVWTRSVDLSDRAELAVLAEAAGLPDLDVGADAKRTAGGWQAAWQDTGLPGVPQLVRRDGRVVYGLADATVLRDFLDGRP